MVDSTDDKFSNGDEDFAALLADSESATTGPQRFTPGDLVRGRVVALGAETAFVAIGGKSEAVIDLAEFRDPETGELHLALGDQLEATVTDDGSRSGSILLKHTLGRGSHVPGELEEAFAHGIAVEGLVTGQNKGGFDVQIAGRQAFCPASYIDVHRGEPQQYVGQRLRFRIRKMDAGGRNIVVSRRDLVEAEVAVQAASTWERLHLGAVMSGTVTALREFGAFVDLGGVEGLIHVSELGYGRVDHPSEVLEVGQTVQAQVVRIDPATEGSHARVALSLRALEPDPWTTVAERFPVGISVRGKVRRLERFGAFVEIAPGLDGLVHASRMALDRHVAHPKQVVAIGDDVEVSVISLDAENRRIGLSMVETARREREAVEQEAAETFRAAEQKSFGTLGDLLAKSKKPKQ